MEPSKRGAASAPAASVSPVTRIFGSSLRTSATCHLCGTTDSRVSHSLLFSLKVRPASDGLDACVAMMRPSGTFRGDAAKPFCSPSCCYDQ